MAHILSQKKRNRQNEKRRIRNSSVKSSIRTAAKKTLKAINGKDESAEALYVKFVKTIDTAVQKGIIHKNTAARKKSRLALKINALKKES